MAVDWGVAVLLMTIMALMSAGCSSVPGLQGGEGVPQGPGISDITPRDEFRQVSLAEALDALKASEMSGADTQGQTHIYYIRGESPDVNGTAKSWAIGAKRGSKQFFFIHDAKASQMMDWNAGLPQQEIDTTTIMRPERLFSSHRLLIQDLTKGGKTPPNGIELRGGVYVLTVQSDNASKDYVFDAMTGKEINNP